MSRLKKIVQNILLMSVFLLVFLNITGLYFSPLSAHEHSERSRHYGPSEIIHIENFNNNKYILGKYDKYVSCNEVNRFFFFFWYGAQPTGFENTKSKSIEYTSNISYKTLKIYGIINDKRITKIEVILDNGASTTITEFYEDLFLYVADTNQFGHTIRGYDINDELIYEIVY